ncbi:hypothetical protein, partial [Escherichia coli]|uniref:hypothetical protein n=1 Tax=Escherichia coli TaxID=562 RepID=UPI001BDC86B9
NTSTAVLSMLLQMNAIAELMHKYGKPEKKFIAKLANVILSAGANSCVTGKLIQAVYLNPEKEAA